MATSRMARPMAGWIMFAAIVMLIVGSIDFFEGLIAVIRKQYYVLTPNQIVVFNMTTWGWLTLIWGIVLVLAGLALISGSGWARWFTVVVASINIVGQLGWLGASAYPLWTLTAIALSVIVIYALVARWEGYPETVG
jgi:C4-dicarboxylate transporter